MSNNYNTILQSNNTDLQAILSTINELPEAGGSEPVLQDKTVTPTTSIQTITADANYDGLDTVTVNAMPTATQATPSITVNSSGLITATATQTAGYVAAGSKSATKQLAFQAAKIITPSTTDQIAVSGGYYTGGNITVKGDSNLVAGNIKSGVSIFGVNGTLQEGTGGGNTDAEDGLVTRTLTSYENSRVSSIGSYAFAYCSKLTSVNFPACTTIGSYAFYSCSRLTSVSFPSCTTIGSYAFSNCKSLISVSFPACTTINAGAFYSCSKLTTVSFPACTTINDSAFNNCTSLTSVNFPACTTIGNYAFYRCSRLTSVSFSVCTTISSYAFQSCSKLTTVNFPVCTTISNFAFQYCSSLTSVNFPACTTISSYAFYGCESLTTIYLLASSVCTLAHSGAFSNTALTHIYVPASLVTSYKTATNWTYFSSKIDGYTTGVGSN